MASISPITPELMRSSKSILGGSLDAILCAINRMSDVYSKIKACLSSSVNFSGLSFSFVKSSLMNHLLLIFAFNLITSKRYAIQIYESFHTDTTQLGSGFWQFYKKNVKKMPRA